MPKIPALLEAERKLALLEDVALDVLRTERAALVAQLAHLDEEIASTLAPVQAILDAAKEQQRWTLGKWVQSEGHASYSRYVVRTDDAPTDACWDNRAWLRVMKHGSDREDGPWLWTLDIKPHNYQYKQITLDPRKKNPSAPRPTPESMLLAADEALREAGFYLIDYTPKEFKRFGDPSPTARARP